MDPKANIGWRCILAGLTLALAATGRCVWAEQASGVKTGYQEEQKMADIRVTKVVGVLPGAAGSGGMLQTDNLGQLAVRDERNWQMVLKYQGRDKPLGIEYDSKTREVALAWPAESDWVIAVGTPVATENRIMVQLMTRPTLLYLDRSGERFEALHHLFEQAAKNKTKLTVGVFPGDDTIRDARLAQ